MTSTQPSHDLGSLGGGQQTQDNQAALTPSTSTTTTTTAQSEFQSQDSTSNATTPRPRSPRKRLRSNERETRAVFVDAPLKPAILSAPGKQAFVPPQPAYSLNITGAAELAEQKRRKLEEQQQQQQQSTASGGLQQTSPNHSRAALNQLQGGAGLPVTPASNLISNPMSLAQTSSVQFEQSRAQPLQQQQTDISTPMQVDTPAPAPSGFENIDSSLLPQSSAAQQGYPPPPPQTASQQDAPQSNTPISSVYPDPTATSLQNTPTTTDLRRHASLPNPAIRRRISNVKDSPGSPSAGEGSISSISHSASTNTPRKHSCQYCGQEFTRQHNLKSHLLTHSQERPYGCDVCDAKFRRLHDLKRHTKLHTGEKPHICPKCKRRFARGDALARHTRGPGGCPGRRSSLGGDADMDGTMDDPEHDSGEPDGDHQDEQDEEMMNGLVYTGGDVPTQEPEGMHDDPRDRDRRDVPGIRHTAASGDSYRSDGPYPRMAGMSGSTYPPIARAPTSTQYGPTSFPPYSQSSNATPTPASQNAPQNQNQNHPVLTGQLPPPNAFPPQHQNQTNILSAPSSAMKITESPKPLSPLNGPGSTPTPTASIGHGHNMLAPSSARSPSLNNVFKNITFDSTSGRQHSKSSPGPPPAPQFLPNQNHSNTLPSLRSVGGPGPGTLSSNPSVSSISSSAASGSMSYMGPPSISSATSHANVGGVGGGGSVYGHASQNSIDRAAALGLSTGDPVWAYIRSMENKIEVLGRELEEVRRENRERDAREARERDREREREVDGR